MTDFWEIPIPIKNPKTDENKNIQIQTDTDENHEDFIHQEQLNKPEIDLDFGIHRYDAALDKSTPTCFTWLTQKVGA